MTNLLDIEKAKERLKWMENQHETIVSLIEQLIRIRDTLTGLEERLVKTIENTQEVTTRAKDGITLQKRAISDFETITEDIKTRIGTLFSDAMERISTRENHLTILAENLEKQDTKRTDALQARLEETQDFIDRFSFEMKQAKEEEKQERNAFQKHTEHFLDTQVKRIDAGLNKMEADFSTLSLESKKEAENRKLSFEENTNKELAAWQNTLEKHFSRFRDSFMESLADIRNAYEKQAKAYDRAREVMQVFEKEISTVSALKEELLALKNGQMELKETVEKAVSERIRSLARAESGLFQKHFALAQENEDRLHAFSKMFWQELASACAGITRETEKKHRETNRHIAFLCAGLLVFALGFLAARLAPLVDWLK